MRRAKARFKHASRRCRAETASLMSKGSLPSTKGDRRGPSGLNTLAQRVDSTIGQNKYDDVLNSVDDISHTAKFETHVRSHRSCNIDLVEVGEIRCAVRILQSSKAINLDEIPNKVYMQAAHIVLVWISLFFPHTHSHA